MNPNATTASLREPAPGWLSAAIFLCLLGFLPGQSTATVIDIIGTPGMPGIDADPDGQPGGPGGPASANSTTAEASNTANAAGGIGGKGGNGTTGFGGHGGPGGTADAAASAGGTAAEATSSAIGGRGGDGGTGSSGGGPGGMGGDALSSMAVATSTTGNASATALAEGGRGGDAEGGALAGNGGMVLGPVRADGFSSTGGDVTVEAVAVGGAGGNGSNGSPGGAGANVQLFDAVGGVTEGTLSLHQSAIGGAAGGTEGFVGFGLPAGTAESNLSFFAGGSQGELHVLNEALGGAGGIGSLGAQGGQGGDVLGVFTSVDNSSSSPSPTFVKSLAEGGRGGDAEGGALAGNGGMVLGPVRADGFSSTGGDVTVEAVAVGGAGGNGSNGSPGGAGANVQLFDAVGGVTEGTLSLHQSAIGGAAGGTEGFVGFGLPAGTAESNLSFFAGGSQGELHVLNEALGGAGGIGSLGAQGGQGGDVLGVFTSVDNSSSSPSPTFVKSLAEGGRGGDAEGGALAGNGGMVLGPVRADGFSSTGGDVTVEAVAVGGAGGNGSNGSPGGAGANVQLFDAVGGVTEGTLSLHQSAIGGAAGGAGGAPGGGPGLAGNAESSLFFNASFDNGDLFATSEARGGYGLDGPDGTAVANLFVVHGNPGAAVDVLAIAEGGTANATATADAASGVVAAEASSSGPGFAYIEAFASAPVGSIAEATSAATFGGAGPGPGFGAGTQAFASVVGSPDAAAVATIVAANDALGLFGGSPGPNALSLFAVGGGYPTNGSGTPETFSSGIEFDLIGGLGTGNTILIGLFDPMFSDQGFVELVFRVLFDGDLLFDRTFDNALSAFSFFDNRMLSLPVASVTSPVPYSSVSLLFDFTATADGRFRVNGLFGVPEPGTYALLVTGLLLVLFRRRFRLNRL